MSDTKNNARWSELLEAAVNQPGTVAKCYSQFHNYSLGNQLLAMLQCAARGIQPGPIGTFMHWKENGRHVRKGEKAITLCMPITIKKQSDKQDEKPEVFTTFVYKNNWFVLTQTDGADYTPEPIPGWDRAQAIESLQITVVPFTLTDGNCQGYAEQRNVAVNPIAEHPERTLFHEMAHVVLGHTAERMNDSGEKTPRDIRELEAECTAMLVCESLGISGVEESRGYVQSWFRGNAVPERSAQRIFHAADQILKAGQKKSVDNN